MLLQTNSYIVPKDKRSEHARLMRRFRQALARIGCDHFEVYEQVGPNWGPLKGGGRFVQILRFRDRQHQTAIQAAEREDPAAQQVIREFCDLVNLPYQQDKGLFALGYYIGVITTDPQRIWSRTEEAADPRIDAHAEGPDEFSTLPPEVDAPPPGNGQPGSADHAETARHDPHE
jgi:hypothetical protein